MDYSQAIPAFVELINHQIEALKDYPELLEVTDTYAAYNPVNDTYINVNGMVISCSEWIDGTPESEYIQVPTPCSKDQYQEICAEVIKRTFWYEKYLTRLEQARHHIEKYVKDFAARLKSEWTIFQGIRRFIPLYVTDNNRQDIDGNYEIITNGTFNGDVVTIYTLNPDRISDAERIARHEVLHLALHDAGFSNDDDNFLFWFFCSVYDGHPYAEMNEANRKFYDTVMRIYAMDEGKELIDNWLVTLRQEIQKATKRQAEHTNT